MSPGHLLSSRRKEKRKKKPLAKECEKKQDLVGTWQKKIPETVQGQNKGAFLSGRFWGVEVWWFEKLKKKKVVKNFARRRRARL